jgi:hypothetical protein
MLQTPDMENAARLAAQQVYNELIAMMEANTVGEVAAVLGFNQLQVEARPRQPRKAIKLVRSGAVIETVR